LRVIQESRADDSDTLSALTREADELMAILTTAVKTTQARGA
jgi:hypothetical protein